MQFIMKNKESAITATFLCDITIADKIKEYRKNNKLSQSDFGKMIGVSAQAVCKWEQNVCYPDITFLPHLAFILECKIDDFFKKKCSQSPNLLTKNDVCITGKGGNANE